MISIIFVVISVNITYCRLCSSIRGICTTTIRGICTTSANAARALQLVRGEGGGDGSRFGQIWGDLFGLSPWEGPVSGLSRRLFQRGPFRRSNWEALFPTVCTIIIHLLLTDGNFFDDFFLINISSTFQMGPICSLQRAGPVVSFR